MRRQHNWSGASKLLPANSTAQVVYTPMGSLCENIADTIGMRLVLVVGGGVDPISAPLQLRVPSILWESIGTLRSKPMVGGWAVGH